MPTNIAKTLYQQMGGHTIHGAIAITGGRKVAFFPDDYDLPQIEPDEKGQLKLVNGLQYEPNVNKRRVKFIIVLQPCDTYTVFLYQSNTINRMASTGIVGEVLDRRDDVYFDQLVDVIDDVYVAHVKEFQQGFISLG